MTEKEIRKKLQDRLEANYQAYIRQLQSRSVPDLIGQAAEIAAAKIGPPRDGCLFPVVYTMVHHELCREELT